MGKVAIFRGISGSGKSAVIEKYFSSAVVCSADDFFTDDKGIYRFNGRFLQRSHDECRLKFKKALRAGEELVVLDNTNFELWQFEDYILLAEQYNYDYEIITLSCDPLVAKERNTHGVGYRKIMEQYLKLEKSNLQIKEKGWPHTIINV